MYKIIYLLSNGRVVNHICMDKKLVSVGYDHTKLAEAEVESIPFTNDAKYYEYKNGQVVPVLKKT